MALKALYDTATAVPEALRDHYVEKDGKFVLGVEPVGGFALEDVTGLKTALGTERTRANTAEATLAKFKDLDPDKAREALTKLQEWGTLDPTKEADKIAESKFEAAKAQLVDKHTAELNTRDDQIKGLRGTVDKLIRQDEAVRAIVAAKGSVELLLPHVLAASRTKEGADGKYSVEVIDAAGNVRIGNGKGDAMTLAELLAEYRENEAYGGAFDGDGHSGSGKRHDNGQGGGTKGDMGGSPAERRVAIAQKYGLKE